MKLFHHKSFHLPPSLPLSLSLSLSLSFYSGTAAFAVLQRMLNFVQGLQYYMSYEVLEPNWRHLEKSLNNVTTIDEVLARHTGECMYMSLYKHNSVKTIQYSVYIILYNYIIIQLYMYMYMYFH